MLWFALALACAPSGALVVVGGGSTGGGTGGGTVEITPPVPPAPETTSAAFAVTDVTAEVHPEMGSIVVVTWEQSGNGSLHLEYSVDDGVWLQSPPTYRGEGPQRELALGVPYGSRVTWRLTGPAYTSPDAEIEVDPLPNGVPEVSSLTAEAGLQDATPYFLISLAEQDLFGDPWWVMIVDRQGRTVWASKSPSRRVSMHSRVARDGRSLLLDRNSYWAIFDASFGTVDRMNIEGEVLHTYETPGLHHPLTDLPDGSIAWGATTGGYQNEYIDVVHDDGSTERLFDCEAWLADIGQSDFCMSNTLSYHEETNRLMFSLFSTEAVVELDRDTGEVVRYFGHAPGAYDFSPRNSAFWWQHGGYITDTGTLLVSSDLSAQGEETIVREYAIDDAAQELVEVWNFGIGQGVYGYQMGEAVRLPGGNTLHNYGEGARLREATPDQQVVWDIRWDSDAIGRSMPIQDLYLLR